jgi:hypothetical protein
VTCSSSQSFFLLFNAKRDSSLLSSSWNTWIVLFWLPAETLSLKRLLVTLTDDPDNVNLSSPYHYPSGKIVVCCQDLVGSRKKELLIILRDFIMNTYQQQQHQQHQ